MRFWSNSSLTRNGRAKKSVEGPKTLVAPKPPQGVLVRGHAGFVINKLFPWKPKELTACDISVLGSASIG